MVNAAEKKEYDAKILKMTLILLPSLTVVITAFCYVLATLLASVRYFSGGHNILYALGFGLVFTLLIGICQGRWLFKMFYRKDYRRFRPYLLKYYRSDIGYNLYRAARVMLTGLIAYWVYYVFWAFIPCLP